MYKVEWRDSKIRKSEDAHKIALYNFGDQCHTFSFRKVSTDQKGYYCCNGCEKSRNWLRQAKKAAEERGEPVEQRPHTMKWIHVVGDEIVNGDPLMGHDAECKSKSRAALHVQTHTRMAAQRVFKGELTPADARIKIHNEMTTTCEQSGIDEDEARSLWNQESIKSLLRKAKTARLPSIDDPLNIPQEYKTTITGKRFQLDVDSDNMVVFIDDRGLSLLRRSAVWKLDGTFKSAPQGFKQVYTIHCRHPDINESIVVLHAFMKRRFKRNYKELFEAVRTAMGPEPITEFTTGTARNPEGVRRRALFDFESGASGAFATVFPEFLVKGCRFHFAKKILSHFDQHMKTLKKDNEEVSDWLKQILGLPLLPEDLVPAVWQSLSIPPYVPEEYEAHIHKFVEYVRATWIENPSVHPISLWNHFDNDMCRTTNSAEGWHSGEMITFILDFNDA